MLEQIVTILSALSPFIWLIIALSMIAASFLVSTLLLYLTGDVIKFKKSAKAFLKEPTRANSIATAKRMPIKVRKLYKRALITNEKPSDVIGIDAGLYGPYQMSIAPKTTLIVFFISFFAMAIAACGAFAYSLSMGFAVLATTAVAGFLFTIIMLILVGSFYKRTARIFNEYVDALDKLVKDGNFKHIQLEGTDKGDTNNEAENDNNYGGFIAKGDFSQDNLLHAPQFNFSQKQDLDPIIATPAKELEVEPAATPSLSFTDADDKSVKAPQQKIIPDETSTAASNLNTTDDLINKIDRAIEDDAPLATLKELALRLQQERTKPINKTGEKQKKLSETQIKLMRAMTGAMKR